MNKRQINILVVVASFLIFTGNAAAGNPAKVILQKIYTYKMGVVNALPKDTFVIKTATKKAIKKYIKKSTQSATEKEIKNHRKKAIFVCYFSFDSSALSSTVYSQKILSLLPSASKKSPLQVIGHTCSIGSEKYNKKLSVKRAKTVADLLQKYGFTVVKIRGLGSSDPITNNPLLIQLNRRVEVKIATLRSPVLP